jgi:hypothetical protein
MRGKLYTIVVLIGDDGYREIVWFPKMYIVGATQLFFKIFASL